ncbi:aa3-type cytochrome oxidase subunit CtaJ [Blastococcus goldschmidtiae]|uniref:Secreted protein n=1 Tax=Blastococcus goldschmidtiae TaxID=3075546 RepID=A0ABU2K8J2_9ACTN|nr:hypothetical protein [Blastococcus sp. DSM 46792]MDT0276514.1 hypothetical protein [Blastococcus sp. DSM 46792]
MTVVETILVFAVVPLAVVLVLALMTLGPGARNRRPRYKPGQPWNHDPIWYEPHPEATGHGGGHGEDDAQALGSSVYPERYGDEAAATHAVSGGTHAGSSATRAISGGSTGGATVASRPRAAGPLGGARGTW